jgi:hypothetical protein
MLMVVFKLIKVKLMKVMSTMKVIIKAITTYWNHQYLSIRKVVITKHLPNLSLSGEDLSTKAITIKKILKINFVVKVHLTTIKD